MQDDLTLQAYHYDLPEANIAQTPAEKRDLSKLLVLDRRGPTTRHLQFKDITRFIRPNDLLVLNDTKVFPARLSGTKESGGKVEVFLLGYPAARQRPTGAAADAQLTGEALIKSSRPPRVGGRIRFDAQCSCTLAENLGRGKWRVQLELGRGVDVGDFLSRHGKVPLPPYIKRDGGPTGRDFERYQTVYARQPGAVAAPTAGLHFTDELLAQLRDNGVIVDTITLHVGHGTFAPVEVDAIDEHVIHREFVEISGDTAERVNTVKSDGGKIWAVGTTCARALEFGGDGDGRLQPFSGWCDLYITPGYRFRVLDNLITNFHLPCSSLMFLVAALCGRQTLLDCYHEAISLDYRFYSYGDAMAIIT